MDGVFVALIVSAVLYAMALFADLTATRLMNLHYNAWVRSTELSRNVEEYWHSWNPGIEIMTQSNGGAQFVGLVALCVAAGNVPTHSDGSSKYPGLYTTLVFVAIFAAIMGFMRWLHLYQTGERRKQHIISSASREGAGKWKGADLP